MPAQSQTYTLSCLLAGEIPVRSEIHNAGAAARFVELPVSEPLLPNSEIPEWYEFATTNYGWFGLDVLDAGVKDVDFWIGHYTTWRGVLYKWYPEAHPRVIDFLAVIETGYRIAALRFGIDESIDATRDFVDDVYRRLDQRTKIDEVLAAFRQIPGVDRWVKRGFIPVSLAQATITSDWADENGWLTKLLIAQGLVKGKPESRTCALDKDDQKKPHKCYMLTPRGQERLSLTTEYDPITTERTA